MPTSLADKPYSFDIPSHLLFQSPLSRGTTPDTRLRDSSPTSATQVSIPSKSGHYSRRGNRIN